MTRECIVDQLLVNSFVIEKYGVPEAVEKRHRANSFVSRENSTNTVVPDTSPIGAPLKRIGGSVSRVSIYGIVTCSMIARRPVTDDGGVRSPVARLYAKVPVAEGFWIPISVEVPFVVWLPIKSRIFACAGIPSVSFKVIRIFPLVPGVTEIPSSVALEVEVAARMTYGPPVETASSMLSKSKSSLMAGISNCPGSGVNRIYSPGSIAVVVSKLIV